MALTRMLITNLIVSILFFVLASVVHAQTIYTPTLIHTVDASKWQPPAPDTCGIVYLPSSNHLLISDSEVDEMSIYQGANVYETTLDGTLVKTYNTLNFSHEPTDLAADLNRNTYFFTDDNQKKIFVVNLGTDKTFGTTDDTITSIDTVKYGCTDTEGIALGDNKLFLACGVDVKIVTLSPGPNGVFDGLDDTATSFSTSSINQSDPEGIEYNPDSNTLFIVSTSAKSVAETTLTGTLVKNIDISPFTIKVPSGLEYAPSSVNSALKSLYIAARGVDNGTDPSENDGKIYEISLSGPPTPKQILLSWLGSAFDRNMDLKVNSFDFANVIR